MSATWKDPPVIFLTLSAAVLLGIMMAGPIVDALWWNRSEFRRIYQAHLERRMTRAEVERLLGPGEKVSASPQLSYGGGDVRPAVVGDEIYLWTRGTEKIWLGFQEGRVCTKYYWVPSL